MAENSGDSGVVNLPPQQPRNVFKDLYENPLVREIVLPIAKREFGINTSNKDVTKKPFGRAMYAIRDVWQGIWWTIPALAASLGIIVVLLKWMIKFLGV